MVPSYANPVIPGFHPDPTICRAGDRYVLVTSSFAYLPGLPVFESGDLVHWTQTGNVFERPSQLDLSMTTWTSEGLYAPTIRYHDDTFWLATSTVGPNGPDMVLLTAPNPAGPWSDPVHIPIRAIDPDLAWDDEGRCVLHCSDSGILRAVINPRTGALIDTPLLTWSGTGMQYPEGPHLFAREDFWYLLIAEGGTERGHAVSVARSSSPYGPWQPCPSNPILSHRSTNHPIQSTGHADLLQSADGSWWMVLLGTRPRGITPGWHILGRETFLAPIKWKDGWPVVGPLELNAGPSPQQHEFAPVAESSLSADGIGPEWLGVRRFPASIVTSSGPRETRPEGLRSLSIIGGTDGLDGRSPAFIGRRQDHFRMRLSARVRLTTAGVAGLALRMDESHYCAVAVRGTAIEVTVRIGPIAAVIASMPSPSGEALLWLETTPAGQGPDIVTLGAGEGSDVRSLAALDGRYFSTEVAGGFTGRVVGIFAINGTATFADVLHLA